MAETALTPAESAKEQKKEPPYLQNPPPTPQGAVRSVRGGLKAGKCEGKGEVGG